MSEIRWFRQLFNQGCRETRFFKVIVSKPEEEKWVLPCLPYSVAVPRACY
jgi:hypothetical protein